jgi:hypothetical protein
VAALMVGALDGCLTRTGLAEGDTAISTANDSKDSNLD